MTVTLSTIAKRLNIILFEESSAATTSSSQDVNRIKQDITTDLLGMDRIEGGGSQKRAPQDPKLKLKKDIEKLQQDIGTLKQDIATRASKIAAAKEQSPLSALEESRQLKQISVTQKKIDTKTEQLTAIQKQLAEEAPGASTHIDAPQRNEAKREVYLNKIKELSPKLIEYLATYEPALGASLFGQQFTQKSQDEIKDNNKMILESFKAFCDDKGYFTYDDARSQNLYIDCYKLFMHRALFLENYEQNEVATRVCKAMVLFGPEPENLSDNRSENIKTLCSNLDRFIQQNASGFNRPIHDIFLYDIPEEYLDELDEPAAGPAQTNTERYNLPEWKKAIEKFGMDLIKNFSDVPQIQKIALNERNQATHQAQSNEYGIPLNGAYLQELIVRCIYTRANEQPGLAKLYKHYNVNEAVFEQTLTLIENKKILIESEGSGKIVAKADDKIPNVAVRLNVSSDLYMVKLPASDPRALILGHITDCCQSIRGHSEQCVIDGITLPNNGFYVFIKANKNKEFDPQNIQWDNLENDKHSIIGQSYVWNGQLGELVLDSLEIKKSFVGSIRPQDIADKIISEIVLQSLEVPTRITVGTGGGTANVFAYHKLPLTGTQQAASMIEGAMYGDAQRQCEIYVSEKLESVRSSIDRLTKDGYSRKKILALTSYNAFKAYATGHVTPDDLIKNINNYTFESLTCDKAFKAYATGHLKPDDFENISYSAFEILTCDNAFDAYATGRVKPDDLKNYDAEEIQFFIYKIQTDQGYSLETFSHQCQIKRIESDFNITQEDLRDLNPTPTYKAIEFAYSCLYNEIEELRTEDYKTKLKPHVLVLLNKNESEDDMQKILDMKHNIRDGHIPYLDEFTGFYSKYGIKKSIELLQTLSIFEFNAPKINDYTAFALSQGISLSADSEFHVQPAQNIGSANDNAIQFVEDEAQALSMTIVGATVVEEII